MADAKLYECKNPACPLGDVKNPGHFTGGITPEQALALSGDPDAEHGEGVCPNCGTAATEVGKFKPGVGSDPFEALHAEVAARVADPDDRLDAAHAQEELELLVAREEEAS